MSRNIMKDIHKHNLCAVYLLPLLEIGMFNFGESNFVNCYVSLEDPERVFLLVEVVAFDETEDPYHNTHYTMCKVHNHRKFIVFTLPEKWKHTVQMFQQGRYSSFTKAAKAMIIQYSGLNWKQKTDKDNITLSDARLLAMYKGAALRDLLSEQLGADIPEDGELISPPKLTEFMEVVFV
jgi:hypothetical protein